MTTNSQPVDRWLLAKRNGKNVEISEDNRIWGKSAISVVFVHVNATIAADLAPEDQFGNVSYRTVAKAKLPRNISDLLGLLQVGVSLFNDKKAQTRVSYMGFGQLTNIPVPSDLTVFGVEPAPSDPKHEGLHLIGQAGQYNDEGKYWWDVSVGVPVNKLSLVDYSQDNQTFVPKTINKQSVYGMANLFLHHVDLDHPGWVPRVVAGIGLTGRPGENVMAGLAWGFPQIQGFFASAWVNQTIPNGGGTQRYQQRWTYGINVPVLSAIKQLSNKKSADMTATASSSAATTATGTNGKKTQ
jgi:hypothetical protein